MNQVVHTAFDAPQLPIGFLIYGEHRVRRSIGPEIPVDGP